MDNKVQGCNPLILKVEQDYYFPYIYQAVRKRIKKPQTGEPAGADR
jgi:hypothetical protein